MDMRKFISFLLVAVGTLAFAGGWFTSAFGENAEETVEKIQSQFTCEGCLEFAEMQVSYGTPKRILLRRTISDTEEAVRIDIVSRGPDYGTRYLSLLKEEEERASQWEYRSGNRKPRRHGPDPTHDILDTGINYFFLNLGGWLSPKRYHWEIREDPVEGIILVGTPTPKSHFLPHLRLKWEVEEESYRITELWLFSKSGTELKKYLFHQYKGWRGKYRPSWVEVIMPNEDKSTITFSYWFFLEKTPEMDKIFYYSALTEGIVDEPGKGKEKILAKIDFLNKPSP